MSWTIHSQSDVGGREEQQDRFLTVQHRGNGMILLAVADGAGGHADGAKAAEAAITRVHKSIPELWQSEDPSNFLSTLALACNSAVQEATADKKAYSTLVIVFAREDQVFWVHVGDSRFYLIRDGKSQFVTRDHSIKELDLSGDPEFDMRKDGDKLYMCLGASGVITPELGSSVLRDEDRLMLCSDGLWGQLEMSEIINEISDSNLTHSDTVSWIDKAKKNRGEYSDNITIVLARYQKSHAISSLIPSWLSTFFTKKS